MKEEYNTTGKIERRIIRLNRIIEKQINGKYAYSFIERFKAKREKKKLTKLWESWYDNENN